MADERKIIMTEDGRNAERIVTEVANESGEVQRTTEVHVEPKVQKQLSHKVVEYIKPVVHKREIHTVDEATGNIETKVESLEPIVKMELREHVLSAQKASSENYVSREELKDLFLSLKDRSAPVVSLSAAPGAYQNPAPVVSYQEVVADKVAQSENLVSKTNLALLAVIAAQLGGVVYIMFYM